MTRLFPPPPLRREPPPRERLDVEELREDRLPALRLLLREGADFDDRLGAEEREGAAAREGAEAAPLERLRLGADCRAGAEKLREGLADREGTAWRLLIELERPVEPWRAGGGEVRWLLERDERLLGGLVERLELRAPLDLVAASRDEDEEERDGSRDEEREDESLRSDSFTRLARLDAERLLPESRLRDALRAGAWPLTVRLRCDCAAARFELRLAERPSRALRVVAAREVAERLRSDDALALRAAPSVERDVALLRERAVRLKFVLERRSAAHSRRSERVTVRLARELVRAEAGLLLSTKRVFCTRPR